MDLVQRGLVDDGADVSVFVQAVPELHLLGAGDELRPELVVDLSVCDDAARGHDDDRVLAAELQVDVLQERCPVLRHLDPDLV